MRVFCGFLGPCSSKRKVYDSESDPKGFYKGQFFHSSTWEKLPPSSLWKSDAKHTSPGQGWLSRRKKRQRTHIKHTRPLTTFGACSPCSISEGSSCPTRSFFTHSFRSILAQGTAATWCTPVKFTKHCLTRAIKSEDERITKGKQHLKLYAKYLHSLLLTVRHN